MILSTKMMMMMMIMKIIMMMIKTLSLRDDAVDAYCSGDLKLIWDSLGILVPREIARGHIQSCLAGIIISVKAFNSINILKIAKA